MIRIMIDLETLGLEENAVILSIGAVAFDTKTKQITDKFYKVINLEDSIANGFQIEADTLRWWLKQSDKARQDVAVYSICTMNFILTEFISWISKISKDRPIEIWSRGINFDLTKLRYAFKKFKIKCPWEGKMERDARTFIDSLINLVPEDKHRANMNQHNALSDAEFQANQIIDICTALSNLVELK